MEESWSKVWLVFCGLILSILRIVSGTCTSKGDTSLVATHLTATTTPQILSYPGGGNYSALTECLWGVYASSDNVLIEITMLDMEVDYSSCRYDSLKIYDGNLNDKLERTLCGTLDNDIPTYYACFVSSTGTAFLQFVSDNYVSGTGFTVRYKSATPDGCASYQTGSSGDGGGLSTWVIVLIVLGVIIGIILIILLILLICCCCCKKKDKSTDRVTPLMEDTDSMKHEKIESEKHYTYTEKHVDETSEKHGHYNKNDRKNENEKENSADTDKNTKGENKNENKNDNKRGSEKAKENRLDDNNETRNDLQENEKQEEKRKGQHQNEDPTSQDAVAALVLNAPAGKANKLPPLDKRESVPMKQKVPASYDKNKNSKNNDLPPVDTPEKHRSTPQHCSTPPLSHKEDALSRTSMPRKPLQDTKIFWTNLVGQNNSTQQ